MSRGKPVKEHHCCDGRIRRFDRLQWLGLKRLGEMDDGLGGRLVLRLCVCGSSISLDDDDARRRIEKLDVPAANDVEVQPCG